MNTNNYQSSVKRFLDTYSAERKILQMGLNHLNKNRSDFSNEEWAAYRAAALRATNLSKTDSTLEQMAMDLAWQVQLIKHPIKMMKLAYSLPPAEENF